MAADYSFDMKNIDIWAPTFLKHNNSFIATVKITTKTTVHTPEKLITLDSGSTFKVEKYRIGVILA